MSPKELALKITEYVDAGDMCPEQYVFIALIELYTDGQTSFTLEEGGILYLTYEEGNSPIIQLTEDARLDFRLINYITCWLDYQWHHSPFTVLQPKRIDGEVTLRKKFKPFKIKPLHEVQ